MIPTLELVAIGAMTGLLAGLLGVGGGFLLIPLLILVEIPMRSAVGLSLLYVACTAASGAISHYRQGTIDLFVAFAVIPGGMLTVPLGAYYAGVLSNNTLQVIFGLLALGAAVALHWQSVQQDPFPGLSVLGTGLRRPPWVFPRRTRVRGTEYLFPVNLLRGAGVGVVIGFISGLLGVGGGWLLLPLLILVVGVPIPIAAGTSLLAILVPAIVGVFSHYGLGHLDVRTALPIVLGGVIGAVLGARGTALISSARLRHLLLLLLIVVGISMIAQGIF